MYVAIHICTDGSLSIKCLSTSLSLYCGRFMGARRAVAPLLQLQGIEYKRLPALSVIFMLHKIWWPMLLGLHLLLHLLCTVRYCSDVTSYSLAILLLNSRNSSLFSRQLSVRVCKKSARVEPSVELQITLDSLYSLKGSTESLISSVYTRAQLSEISSHQ